MGATSSKDKRRASTILALPYVPEASESRDVAHATWVGDKLFELQEQEDPDTDQIEQLAACACMLVIRASGNSGTPRERCARVGAVWLPSLDKALGTWADRELSEHAELAERMGARARLALCGLRTLAEHVGGYNWQGDGHGDGGAITSGWHKISK